MRKIVCPLHIFVYFIKPHIYPIMRIPLLFVQFSLLCYEFCILSKTECKSIYYHFRPDHQSSSFRKLARDKWICRETCDFFSYTFFFAFSPLVNSIIVFFFLSHLFFWSFLLLVVYFVSLVIFALCFRIYFYVAINISNSKFGSHLQNERYYEGIATL